MTGKREKTKHSKIPKTEEGLWIRLSAYEKNRLKFLADRFANGNLSAWLVYGGLNVTRKHLTAADFPHSVRINL